MVNNVLEKIYSPLLEGFLVWTPFHRPPLLYFVGGGGWEPVRLGGRKGMGGRTREDSQGDETGRN